MTFQESIKVCLTQKYAVFSGRASRSEYWFFYLFSFLAQTILNLILPVLGTIFLVAAIVPSLAVASRRLHDRNMSAWWMVAPLLCYFLTFIMAFIVLAFEETGFALFMTLFIAFFVTIVWSIVLFAKEGTHGPNRFGEIPYDLQNIPSIQSSSTRDFSKPDTSSQKKTGTSENTSSSKQGKEFCPYCGGKISPGACYCSSCGKMLE